MKRVFRDQGELDASLASWQKKLRLQDWNITAQFRRATTLAPGTVGSVDIDIQHSTAVIYVVPPEDRPADSIMPYNAEWTLVHELLHVMTARPQEDKELEITINKITRILLGL